MNEIKPCPFCGCNDIQIWFTDSSEAFCCARCEQCGATAEEVEANHFAPTEKEFYQQNAKPAFEKWNKRVIM